MNKHYEPLNEFGKWAVSKLKLDWKTTGAREQTASVTREQLIQAGLIHPQQYVENAVIRAKWRDRHENMYLEYNT